MSSFLKELFDYNYHSNQRLAELLMEHEHQVSEKSISLFSHILNAQHIWNCRMNAVQPLYAVWDLQSFTDFKNIDTDNYERSIAILNKVDLTDDITYRNSKGVFTNSYRDILFHIINHSTYHRAQIATECKLAGIEPLSTDYIFYKRS